MGILEKWEKKNQEKQLQREKKCRALLAEVESALAYLKKMFSDKCQPIDPTLAQPTVDRFSDLLLRTDTESTYDLRKLDEFATLQASIWQLYSLLKGLPRLIAEHNGAVEENQRKASLRLIGKIEGHMPDRQQADAILDDAHNLLVLAGAGTGKTTTIIGKVRYLLKSKICSPSEILVLSFTNASASEMQRRLAEETGEKIAACTFHKLGLALLTEAEGQTPKITDCQLQKFCLSYLQRPEVASLPLVLEKDPEELAQTLETAISLLKNNGLQMEDLKKKAQKSTESTENLAFLQLLEPVYRAYQTKLLQSREVDFSDMILLAAQAVKKGGASVPFQVVIVDEYQDISGARLKLLLEMRKKRNFDLFCVGDDWQSIYRFAGSDVGYILKFEKYFGPTSIHKIETTYRFPQSLIDVSSRFVTRNPLQIKKEIRGRADKGNSFGVGIVTGTTAVTAMASLAKHLLELEEKSTVFLIGRYASDKNMISNQAGFTIEETTDALLSVTFGKRPDLQIHFLTVHKSKGLQADYVFILNTKEHGMGFPSHVQDPPVIRFLLACPERYPYAEERRLFYVALTRAKKKVWLLTLSGNTGLFAKEILADCQEELDKRK